MVSHLIGLVIANFYMEYFEKITLEAAEHKQHKPSAWYRYVADDTLVVWKHEKKIWINVYST